MASAKKPTANEPSGPAEPGAAPLTFASLAEWLDWLAAHHASSRGVWLRIAKKDGGQRSVTYSEAIEGALIWGWIDGQKGKLDDAHWLQRFSPRAARSPWSRINRDKATALEAAGKLAAPGAAELERARRDGRWERAYDGARTSTVPDDLAAALAANGKAAAFFATIDRNNRYALLYRVQAVVKPETRARKIAEYVAMLARGETIHPPRGNSPARAERVAKTSAAAANEPPAKTPTNTRARTKTKASTSAPTKAKTSTKPRAPRTK